MAASTFRPVRHRGPSHTTLVAATYGSVAVDFRAVGATVHARPMSGRDSDRAGARTTDGVPAPPARAATAPRRSTWRRLLGRTLGNAWDDDIFSESAAAAFWQTLSLPPLLLGIFGILGYVGGAFGPDTITAVQQWIIEVTGGVFSRNALDEIIAPTVTDILSTARAEVVSVGFVLSLW